MTKHKKTFLVMKSLSHNLESYKKTKRHKKDLKHWDQIKHYHCDSISCQSGLSALKCMKLFFFSFLLRTC